MISANFHQRFKAQPTERRQPKLDTRKMEEIRQNIQQKSRSGFNACWPGRILAGIQKQCIRGHHRHRRSDDVLIGSEAVTRGTANHWTVQNCEVDWICTLPWWLIGSGSNFFTERNNNLSIKSKWARRYFAIMPLFKQVRYLNDRKNPKIGAVNFISGLMLEEKTAQLDRWKGHLAKPLNARRLVINPNLTACAQQTTDKNLLEPDPLQ